MSAENEIQTTEIKDITSSGPQENGGAQFIAPENDSNGSNGSPATNAANVTNGRPTSRYNLSTLSRQRASTADLIKAHIALMEREVLLPKHGDLFRLVQHHCYRLQTWHDQYTGWRIQRTSIVIRLVRQPSATTPGYLYERLKEPRDFACLTWILWYAEHRQLSGRGNDSQFLLSQLAEQIVEQSAQGASNELKFDFRKPSELTYSQKM